MRSRAWTGASWDSLHGVADLLSVEQVGARTSDSPSHEDDEWLNEIRPNGFPASPHERRPTDFPSRRKSEQTGADSQTLLLCANQSSPPHQPHTHTHPCPPPSTAPTSSSRP